MRPNAPARVSLALLVLALGPSLTAASAQTSFFDRYAARIADTQRNQPHWATPLITVNARVEQGFRTDFVRQTTAAGQTTWNYGGTKGLQLVPLPRTEIRFSPPAFFTHSNPAVLDGFGDIGLRLKYRVYGSNEQQHNAIATVELSATLPTGKQANGSCCAILTPNLELGKGFGRFALTTTAGGTLPASNTARLGRSILFNNAIQYQLTRFIWIETEFNTTFYKGGRNDGHQQTFTTPGLIVSRLPLRRGNATGAGSLLLTLGGGEQIALTHFNTYKTAPVVTARLRF